MVQVVKGAVAGGVEQGVEEMYLEARVTMMAEEYWAAVATSTMMRS